MSPVRTSLIACAAIAFLAIAARSSAEVHVLVVTGVAGDDEHAGQFHRWASALLDAAIAHGVPADNVVYLADRSQADPRMRGRSSRANVEHAFEELSATQPDDEVIVVLIGHGSFDGRSAAFNLPGPDLTAEDYARLLQKIRSQHVAFVDTSSSSGAFLTPLAGPGRVIVTATKTGGERNETRFPEFFAEAFTSDAADKDHDGRVTLLEAFDYARGKVTEAYQKGGLVQTEHPALEDGADGAFAATMTLGASSALAATAGDPALKTLLDERHQLELRVAALRQRKGSMPQAEYDAELERLLLDLATKTRAIQQLQGKK